MKTEEEILDFLKKGKEININAKISRSTGLFQSGEDPYFEEKLAELKPHEQWEKTQAYCTKFLEKKGIQGFYLNNHLDIDHHKELFTAAYRYSQGDYRYIPHKYLFEFIAQEPDLSSSVKNISKGFSYAGKFTSGTLGTSIGFFSAITEDVAENIRAKMQDRHRTVIEQVLSQGGSSLEKASILADYSAKAGPYAAAYNEKISTLVPQNLEELKEEINGKVEAVLSNVSTEIRRSQNVIDADFNLKMQDYAAAGHCLGSIFRIARQPKIANLIEGAVNGCIQIANGIHRLSSTGGTSAVDLVMGFGTGAAQGASFGPYVAIASGVLTIANMFLASKKEDQQVQIFNTLFKHLGIISNQINDLHNAMLKNFEALHQRVDGIDRKLDYVIRGIGYLYQSIDDGFTALTKQNEDLKRITRELNDKIINISFALEQKLNFYHIEIVNLFSVNKFEKVKKLLNYTDLILATPKLSSNSGEKFDQLREFAVLAENYACSQQLTGLNASSDPQTLIRLFDISHQENDDKKTLSFGIAAFTHRFSFKEPIANPDVWMLIAKQLEKYIFGLFASDEKGTIDRREDICEIINRVIKVGESTRKYVQYVGTLDNAKVLHKELLQTIDDTIKVVGQQIHDLNQELTQKIKDRLYKDYEVQVQRLEKFVDLGFDKKQKKEREGHEEYISMAQNILKNKKEQIEHIKIDVINEHQCIYPNDSVNVFFTSSTQPDQQPPLLLPSIEMPKSLIRAETLGMANVQCSYQTEYHGDEKIELTFSIILVHENSIKEELFKTELKHQVDKRYLENQKLLLIYFHNEYRSPRGDYHDGAFFQKLKYRHASTKEDTEHMINTQIQNYFLNKRKELNQKIRDQIMKDLSSLTKGAIEKLHAKFCYYQAYFMLFYPTYYGELRHIFDEIKVFLNNYNAESNQYLVEFLQKIKTFVIDQFNIFTREVEIGLKSDCPLIYQKIEDLKILLQEGYFNRNSFTRIFLGDDTLQNPSCLRFKSWYHPDICHGLLQKVENKAQCVRVMFYDGDGNNIETFKKQIQTLILLGEKFNRFMVFIGKEPGAQNHFIFGLIREKNFLLINPLGTTEQACCYQTLAELQNEKILNKIFLSNTSLQVRKYEEDGLVSCGPISLELATHVITHFTYEALGKFWEQLLMSTELTRHESFELTYHKVPILGLLPRSLSWLLEKSKEDYQKQICTIRKNHYEQLSKLRNEDAEFLKSAPAQIVFNRLYFSSESEDNAIKNIEKSTDFELLLKDLGEPPIQSQNLSGNTVFQEGSEDPMIVINSDGTEELNWGMSWTRNPRKRNRSSDDEESSLPPQKNPRT